LNIHIDPSPEYTLNYSNIINYIQALGANLDQIGMKPL